MMRRRIAAAQVVLMVIALVAVALWWRWEASVVIGCVVGVIALELQDGGGS